MQKQTFTQRKGRGGSFWEGYKRKRQNIVFTGMVTMATEINSALEIRYNDPNCVPIFPFHSGRFCFSLFSLGFFFRTFSEKAIPDLIDGVF